MVVTALPLTADTGVTHERLGSPPRCTVQAPHCAMPQPNLVPVRPRLSRRTQSRGVLAATSTDCRRPFTRREYTGIGYLGGEVTETWRAKPQSASRGDVRVGWGRDV